MAGLRGNQAWFMIEKQTNKEVYPAVSATTTVKTPYSAGNIGPSREIGKLAETDSARDEGVAYAKTMGIKGNPECYVRDASIVPFLVGVLGADAASETSTGNWQHKITPANSMVYNTLWSMLGETLWEKHLDCFISDLDIKATAGSPLTAQSTVIGRKTERLEADPSAIVTQAAGTVYNFNNAAFIELGGSPTHRVSSMNLTIANNVTAQQTDNIVPLDVAAGKRTISCTFDLIFENLKEYNKFFYATESGTTPAASIYVTPLTFKYELTAKNVIEFKIPVFAYEEFPVAPEVQGAPLVVAVKGVAQRTAGNIMEAVVLNQVGTY